MLRTAALPSPKYLKRLAIPFMIFAAGLAAAGTGSISTTVKQVMISADGGWGGGCMAFLAPGPETVLPACGAGWVTFSCSGDFNDPARAYRMADVAEHALATGRSVKVWFGDDVMHDGYCFANAISIIY